MFQFLSRLPGHAVSLVQFPGLTQEDPPVYLKANRGSYSHKLSATEVRGMEFLFPQRREVKAEAAAMEARRDSFLSHMYGDVHCGAVRAWRELGSVPGYDVIWGPVQHPQKVGNCTWASTKLGLLGIMLYLRLRACGALVLEGDHFNIHAEGRLPYGLTVGRVIEGVVRAYKCWSLWDRVRGLVDYVDAIVSSRCYLDGAERARLQGCARAALGNIRQYAAAREGHAAAGTPEGFIFGQVRLAEEAIARIEAL